jgi:hypothetical protein
VTRAVGNLIRLVNAVFRLTLCCYTAEQQYGTNGDKVAGFMGVNKIAKTHIMSARTEQLGFYWTDFHEIRFLSIFRKSLEKIKFNYNRYFISRPIYSFGFVFLE